MTDPSTPTSDARHQPVNHRARTYERPDFPFRCGRERLWSLACGRGPNVDGSCGGVSECLPVRKGDRWHCSRPASAGGACQNGPKPDGSCYINRPPCRPRSSMRAKRRHASLFALLVSLSIIATFFATSSGLFGFDRNLSIPGELTAAHANLIDGNRCGLCHEGHKREGFELVAAIVDYQDLSAQCINCHEFDGHALLPHNKPPLQAGGVDKLGCIACHTEHKGAEADIAALPDRDCHQCHEPAAVFDDFSGRHGKPHPPFSQNYGRSASSMISFDHAKHLDVHFNKAEHQENRPKDCLACHEATEGPGDVTIPSFDVGCAACHEEDIRDRPLLLLAWPELEGMEAPSDDVRKACRMTASWDPEDFEAASYELPGLIEAFLMDIDPDDIEGYGASYQNLARLLALEGVKPLTDLVASKGGDSKKLLTGLSPETVSRPACHWLANVEYEGFASPGEHGWLAEPLSLSYRPHGHADPTLKAWLDYGHGLSDDMASFDVVDDLKVSLFDSETGPGSCISCHKIDDGPALQWQSSSRQQAHTSFTHRPHLSLAKAEGGDLCIGCHQLDRSASGMASFTTLTVSTCQECHGKDGVGASCATCHGYHPSR